MTEGIKFLSQFLSQILFASLSLCVCLMHRCVRMRRAKMDRPFTNFTLFLLLIATATATNTTTNGSGNNSTTNGGAKSGVLTRMGGAAPPPPRMGGAALPPPKTGRSPPPPPKTDGTTPPHALLPIEQEFLNAHNEARYHAGLPLLNWDSKVAAYAQWYAKSHIKDCKLEHSTGPFGENIFWGEGRTWTPRMAVRDWIKEHRYYNKRFHQCQSGQLCGHYTQIIWRDTEKVGCGMVLCGPGDTYIVCSYDPPGNYRGKKPFEKHNPAMYQQKDRMQRISWIPNN